MKSMPKRSLREIKERHDKARGDGPRRDARADANGPFAMPAYRPDYLADHKSRSRRPIPKARPGD